MDKIPDTVMEASGAVLIATYIKHSMLKRYSAPYFERSYVHTTVSP